MIVETDASKLEYGGILKQRLDNSIEELVRLKHGQAHKKLLYY